MIYKATVILSLLFLTLSGSAQSDVGGTYTTLGQPQSALSSETQTVTPTPICPSGPPSISLLPTASDSFSGWVHSHIIPSDCQSYSAIPTVTAGFQQPPSGVLPSGAPDSSLVPPGPSTFSPIISGCQPYIIPTATDAPPFSGSALPTTFSGFVPGSPYTTISLGGTQPDNSSPATASSSVYSSGPIQQGPPVSTETPTSYVGRRRLIRRQV